MVVAVNSYAQSIDSLLNKAQQLEKQMKEASALGLYREVLSKDSTNLTALNQSAILTVREGKRQKNTKAAEPYFNVAKNYASRALEANTDNKTSLVALSMALQQLSLHAGAKEKAIYLKDIKGYLQKALQIDSTYATAWHLLGNWNAELSQMNFAERAATKLLFGGLPNASLDAAISCYKKCLHFNPTYILNYYDLAQAYHSQEDDVKAMAILQKAIRLRPIQQDDRNIQEACKKMLESLQ